METKTTRETRTTQGIIVGDDEIKGPGRVPSTSHHIPGSRPSVRLRHRLLVPNDSVIVPIWKLSQVHVRIGNFVIPIDFVVVDAYRRPDSPMILGRQILATVGAVINTESGVTTFTRLGCRFKSSSAVENEFTTLGFQEDDSDNETNNVAPPPPGVFLL